MIEAQYQEYLEKRDAMIDAPSDWERQNLEVAEMRKPCSHRLQDSDKCETCNRDNWVFGVTIIVANAPPFPAKDAIHFIQAGKVQHK